MVKTKQRTRQKQAPNLRQQKTPALPDRVEQTEPATAASALARMRQSAMTELMHSAPSIVRALREKAEEGSYLHARFLLDLVNESAAADRMAETENTEESLAGLLLQHLRLNEQSPETDTEANESRRIESQVS